MSNKFEVVITYLRYLVVYYSFQKDVTVIYKMSKRIVKVTPKFHIKCLEHQKMFSTIKVWRTILRKNRQDITNNCSKSCNALHYVSLNTSETIQGSLNYIQSTIRRAYQIARLGVAEIFQEKWTQIESNPSSKIHQNVTKNLSKMLKKIIKKS